MTTIDTIKLAREVGLGTALTHGGGENRVWIEGADWHDELVRFAALAYAAGQRDMRDRCASVCFEEGPSLEGELIADAIRALPIEGEKT